MKHSVLILPLQAKMLFLLLCQKKETKEKTTVRIDPLFLLKTYLSNALLLPLSFAPPKERGERKGGGKNSFAFLLKCTFPKLFCCSFLSAERKK